MQYKRSFTNFLTLSDEKNKEIRFLHSFLNGRFYDRLLDVGGGTGIIHDAVRLYFKNADVIEKNSHFRSYYTGLDTSFYREPIETFHTEKKYDVVLASHVMSYVNPSERKRIIDKLFGFTKLGGYLIFSEMTPWGSLGTIKELIFGKKIFSTYESIVESIEVLGHPFAEYTMYPSVLTYEESDMLRVIKFFSES